MKLRASLEGRHDDSSLLYFRRRNRCRPPPTSLRYCINGVAMNFKPE